MKWWFRRERVAFPTAPRRATTADPLGRRGRPYREIKRKSGFISVSAHHVAGACRCGSCVKAHPSSVAIDPHDQHRRRAVALSAGTSARCSSQRPSWPPHGRRPSAVDRRMLPSGDRESGRRRLVLAQLDALRAPTGGVGGRRPTCPGLLRLLAREAAALRIRATASGG